MAIQIQFRRGTASEWTSIDPILAEGEMGIETDTDLFKIGNGVNAWSDLDYGGLRGYQGSAGPTGYTGSIGNIAVDNVLYVSKSGDDSNSGDSLNTSKLTIKSAVEAATFGTTIFVKSGDYTEDNPMNVPEGVAIVGDSLRTVTVRPLNKTEDLFHVNNAVYLTQMTFKDHEAPSAAVAFPTDGSIGVVHTSPYVQNCTSMTTTGTGMRVDGDHSAGLRSMVVDAFTQYNQGGIGIHMLNRGNTQLVSVFTICCDVGFLCESGGFCSITNSNSSFGNYALKADGVSNALYTAELKGNTTGDTIVLDNLIQKPNYGDAVKFAGDPNYYTVDSIGNLLSGGAEEEGPDFSVASAVRKNARNAVLDAKSKIQTDTIDFLNETYPDFDFNQFKCTRDVGLILDAVADDMVFGTNYRSVRAGLSYTMANASNVINGQLTETVAGLEFARDQSLAELTEGTAEYLILQNNWNEVIDILENGAVAADTLNYTTGLADPDVANASLILGANKNFLIEEGIAFIADEYPALTYNESTCRRDIGLIIDAIRYDLLYGGNSATISASNEYYAGGYLQFPADQKTPTAETFAYIRDLAVECITNNLATPRQTTVTQNRSLTAATSAEAETVGGLFDITVDLVANGYTCTITIQGNLAAQVLDNTDVSFHQFSLITSSGHTFEWIGAGTNVNTALPYLGGVPITENQVVEANQGKVYFTGTDQQGDFRIGNDFVINRDTGTISGRTFTKSLFAVMTPYILAIGD